MWDVTQQSPNTRITLFEKICLFAILHQLTRSEWILVYQNTNYIFITWCSGIINSKTIVVRAPKIHSDSSNSRNPRQLQYTMYEKRATRRRWYDSNVTRRTWCDWRTTSCIFTLIHVTWNRHVALMGQGVVTHSVKDKSLTNMTGWGLVDVAHPLWQLQTWVWYPK